MKTIIFIISSYLLSGPILTGHSQTLDLNGDAVMIVKRLKRQIKLVQPFLKEKKYTEYAVGIYRASLRYGIAPHTLIAIIKQESAFRENLPEGKAGELGIAQIRKNWIQNPHFRREFKRATIADLHSPAWSFMFAAWILKDLRTSVRQSQTPYWTFYNSRALKHRMAYLKRVGRYLSAIETGTPVYRAVAQAEESNVAKYWQPEIARSVID